jgi:hypothetical protein
MRIRDPGWKKFGSGIWYKHISDPQHCLPRVSSNIVNFHKSYFTLVGIEVEQKSERVNILGMSYKNLYHLKNHL